MEFKVFDNKISYVDEQGNELAKITFPEVSEGVFEIDHTIVDESLRGQGIAGKLVKQAVDEITKRGGKVTASCSYAKKWLEKNS